MLEDDESGQKLRDNAAMCLIGLVILTVGVWSWNRYLARRGDPGEQPVAAWDREADVRGADVPA